MLHYEDISKSLQCIIDKEGVFEVIPNLLFDNVKNSAKR